MIFSSILYYSIRFKCYSRNTEISQWENLIIIFLIVFNNDVHYSNKVNFYCITVQNNSDFLLKKMHFI